MLLLLLHIQAFGSKPMIKNKKTYGYVVGGSNNYNNATNGVYRFDPNAVASP